MALSLMWHSGQSERVFKQTAQTIISCPLISFMFSVQPSFLSLFILLSSLPPSLPICSELWLLSLPEAPVASLLKEFLYGVCVLRIGVSPR